VHGERFWIIGNRLRSYQFPQLIRKAHAHARNRDRNRLTADNFSSKSTITSKNTSYIPMI
jgi:hypothetical protein